MTTLGEIWLTVDSSARIAIAVKVSMPRKQRNRRHIRQLEHVDFRVSWSPSNAASASSEQFNAAICRITSHDGGLVHAPRMRRVQLEHAGSPAASL